VKVHRSRGATNRVERSVRRCIAAVFVLWRKAGHRPVLATAVIAACSLVSILLITAFAGIQEPAVHDELAQVAQADIFAHGRLAEAPHPFWQHFETFHMLSQPAYQAKYPPAPALLMAAGEKLTGLPIVGVWLSVVVMIFAVGYAMRGLMPMRWAVLGTSLVALRFGVAGVWPHGYWGIAVAAAGGALVIGGIARLRISPRRLDGALLSTGVVLLVLSRPYEGLAYSLPPLTILGWALSRPSPLRRALWREVVPTVAMIAVVGCGWLGYYNWRITGSPVMLPYVAYEHAYSAAPVFIWQKPREPAPTLRHVTMQQFEREFAMQRVLLAQSRWPVEQIARLVSAIANYLKPVLPLALFGLLFVGRTMRSNVALAASPCLSIIAAMVLACWIDPRYMAPATASIFALVTIGLRGLSRLESRWVDGSSVAVVLVLLFAATVPLDAVQQIIARRNSSDWWLQKRNVRQRLYQLSGDDLVFVRYDPSHNFHHEWVYNGADIDHQPIVWAREIDAASDERLRNYFDKRHAWVVFADETPARFVEWSGRPISGSAAVEPSDRPMVP